MEIFCDFNRGIAAVASRRYLSEGSMALLDRLDDDDVQKEVDGARALLLAS